MTPIIPRMYWQSLKKQQNKTHTYQHNLISKLNPAQPFIKLFIILPWNFFLALEDFSRNLMNKCAFLRRDISRTKLGKATNWHFLKYSNRANFPKEW